MTSALRAAVCRAAFGLPEDLAYLNTATLGPQLRASTEAAERMLRAKEDPRQLRTVHFFEPVERVRELFAQLIGAARSDSVALVPSVSYGLATVAANTPLEAGERVVSVADVFPSTYYTWANAAARSGAELHLVPAPERAAHQGALARAWNERILEAIDSRAAVVSLPQVHWSQAVYFDLEAIGRRCREVGAKLVVDATQSVGAHPFLVGHIKCDALIVGGYKWLLGAYGLGYLYLGEAYHEGQPLEQNWINREGSQNFARLTNYTPQYRSGASRFGFGEHSNFVNVAVAEPALRQLLDWTPEACVAWARRCYDRLYETCPAWLREQLAPPEEVSAPHLVALPLLQLDQAARRQLAHELEDHQVTVSYRGDSMRVSLHASTRLSDVEHLTRILQRCELGA